MSDTVTFTDRGAAKMQEVLAAVPDADGAGLRIDVIAGGCSGYQYRLALDEPADGDLVFEDRGVRIVVRNEHLPFVRGAEVDYVEDESGPSLRINNPNIVYGCSCSNSFMLREEAATA
jgi:iron-sulfur cluster assembly accessory protein